MKRIFLALLLSLLVFISADVTPQKAYIDKYAHYAVQEMYRSGVPASITLAQGMLESRYGLSELASKGNNHFGIKCHDWKGKTMKMDDDKKGECFRVYDSAYESFKDHSDFLRYRNRYHFLFDYKTSDYKSWAYGLKQAGYATDPQYASKLIRIIEDYNLDAYDSMKPSDFGDIKDEVKKESKEEKKDRKLRRQRKNREELITEKIPDSPNEMQEAAIVPVEGDEVVQFSLSRQVYTQNGVKFVYAMEGDTYSSLAETYNLFLKEILKFNDLPMPTKIAAGEVIYIQAKKNQATKGFDKYIVEADGESLRDICQEYAVKEKSIMKINGFASGHKLREGDTIILRK